MLKRFFFASSSSIYGDTKKLPSIENDISQEKIYMQFQKILMKNMQKYIQKNII